MFYDIYSALCSARGKSRSKVAEEIGLSNSTVTKWKKTGATPDGATLSKVGSYFNVPIEFLLGLTVEAVLAETEYQINELKLEIERETDAEKKETLEDTMAILEDQLDDLHLALKLSHMAKKHAEDGRQCDKDLMEVAKRMSAEQVNALTEFARKMLGD